MPRWFATLRKALPAARIARPAQVDFSRTGLVFSIPGLIFLGLMMFMGLAAANSQVNLLFGVFGLMIGVLLVSVSISRVVLLKLRVTRLLPEHAIVGRRMAMTYEIINQKRFWPSLSITIGECEASAAFTRQPLAYMLHAAPAMTAVIATELIPQRRGVHALDRYQIATSFPFGFIRRAAQRRQKDTLLVYPAVGQVDPKLLQRFAAAEKSGAMLRPRRGGADEFYGVKEFRRGENPRWIYWKRSARTGVLVSKEMTLVSPPRIVILVDGFLSGKSAEERARVEQTIAMAGSLASHALEAGIMVGLCAWSDAWVSMTPSRGKRHRRDLMSNLARLATNTTHDAGRLIIQAGDLVPAGTTPVLLTPRQAANAAESLRGLVVLSLTDPRTLEAFKFDKEVDFSRGIPA